MGRHTTVRLLGRRRCVSISTKSKYEFITLTVGVLRYSRFPVAFCELIVGLHGPGWFVEM